MPDYKTAFKEGIQKAEFQAIVDRLAGRLRTVKFPIMITPAGITCKAVLFAKTYSSLQRYCLGSIEFTSAGQIQTVKIPVIWRPTDENTTFEIDVYHNQYLIQSFKNVD